MANYFFKITSDSYAFDELVYNVNYTSGSAIFTGSSDVWTPTTGTLVVKGPKVFDSYIFSPRNHGNLADMYYSPPEKYFYSRLNRTTPPITTNLASSSFRLSTNQDAHSRIFLRFQDEVSSVPEGYVTAYTELV